MCFAEPTCKSTGLLRLPLASDPFIRRIRHTILERRLIVPGQTVLVACSGGADSTALAVALSVIASREGIRLCVGHVNHRLRGEEGDADAEWVRRLSEMLDWPFSVEVVDVPRLRAERGGSVEEVARTARYEALHSMAAAAGAERIATAHHLEDQAETVLMHILRGTGLTGLAGMTWGPETGVIRPLLGTPREALRMALRRWNIPWREDSSNRSLEPTRNRLRHILLPTLEREWNPKIIQALARLAELASADAMALDAWVGQIWPVLVRNHTSEFVVLDGSGLRSYPSGIRRRVIRCAARSLRTVLAPLSHAETEHLVCLVERRGTVVLRGRLNAWSTPDTITLEAADAWRGPTAVNPDGETRIPGWGTLRMTTARPVATSTTGSLLWPKESLRGSVVLRRWREGDRIVGRGAKSALIADVARRRRPLVDPRMIVVMEDSERIIWVPGLLASAAPDATPGTEMVTFEWERESNASAT